MAKPIIKAKGMFVFVSIWLGQLISLLGSSISNFALDLWVYQHNGSVTQLSFLILFTTLPYVVISSFAGVLVDRYDRRWVMIISDSGAALSTVIVIALLVTGQIQIWHVYLASAVNSSFVAFQWPAYNAAITSLVPKEHLGRANGMIQLARASGQLVAPVFGGVLLKLIQLSGIFVLDLTSFLFALASLLLVRFPQVKKSENNDETSIFQEIFYGFRYLIIRSGLAVLLLFISSSSFLFGIFQVLAYPLILSFASSTQLGIILSVGGVGMLVGSLLMSTWGNGRQNYMKIIFCFALLNGFCLVIAGLHSSVFLAGVVAFLFLFGLSFINSSAQVIFQKKVDSDVQGRVFSVQNAINGFCLALAYLIAGPLADKVFEPLMTVNGFLAGTIGQFIGTGPGRGIGLMFIILGMLTVLMTVIAYQYNPLRLVEVETLMIRILLVDDQNVVRQRLKAVLKHRPKLKIVGVAEDGNSALEQVKTLKPDVALVDIEMPGMNGITVTKNICQKFPETKVLILSSHEKQEYVLQAIESGAKGYVLKSTLAEDLELAIRSVYRGYSQIESRLLAKALPQPSFFKSTNSVKPNNKSALVSNHLVNNSLNLHSDNNSIFNLNSEQLQNEESRKIRKDELGYPRKKTLGLSLEPSESDTENLIDSYQQTSDKSNLLTERADELIEQKPKPQFKKAYFFKYLKWSIGGLIVISILSTVVMAFIRFLNRPEPQPITSASIPTKPPEITTVAALGRIEPKGEVMSLSAPTSLEAVQVEQLLVQLGDRIKKGQIIAILDGRQRQQAALDEAKTQSAVAQSRLEKVKTGAKQGTINARKAAIANVKAELAGEIQTQQSTIAKLVAELDNAQTEFQRNQRLYNQGAISTSELDSKRLALRTAQERLNEGRANLGRTQRTLNAQLAEARAVLEETAEVRPVDIQIAQAELKQAQAAVAKAEADMELAYVRAPVDGEILDIHTRPGEALDENGIADIGQTNRMMVIAEIDQNDVAKIKIGQKAIINSGVFPKKLHGKVHQVGSLIGKSDVLDSDPAADEDSRVVEVGILLAPEDSKKVAKLTNLEVDVVIKL